MLVNEHIKQALYNFTLSRLSWIDAASQLLVALLILVSVMLFSDESFLSNSLFPFWPLLASFSAFFSLVALLIGSTIVFKGRSRPGMARIVTYLGILMLLSPPAFLFAVQASSHQSLSGLAVAVSMISLVGGLGKALTLVLLRICRI